MVPVFTRNTETDISPKNSIAVCVFLLVVNVLIWYMQLLCFNLHPRVHDKLYINITMFIKNVEQARTHSYIYMLVNPLIAPALLGATISNTLCWDAHMYHLIKKCNSYLFLLSRINVLFYYLEGTWYCFTTLIFYLILIYVVLSGVTIVLHWKINL